MFRRFSLPCTIAFLLSTSTGCGSKIGDFIAPSKPAFTVKKTLNQTYEVGDKPELTVDTFNGAIAFVAGPGKKVEIEVVKEGWGETNDEAEANLENVQITMQQTGGAVTVTALSKLEPSPGKMGPGKADVVIKGPADALVNLKTSFGGIQATGVAGTLKARSSSGAITATQIRGPFDLSSGFGAIKVDGPGGGKIKSSSGEIVANGCQAALDLDTGFGKIEAKDGKEVKARTSSGAIKISNCSGPLELKSGFGTIEVTGAKAAVTAESKSGNVDVRGEKGPFTVKSGFGKVSVEGKGGQVTAESSSGNIEIRGAGGLIKAHSGYGVVDVEGDKALLDLKSNSGNVQFKGSLDSGVSSVHTGYGSIQVGLPAEAQFRLEAKSGFGKVSTDFPIVIQKSSDRELVGSVGKDPSATLKLTSSNGTIRVGPR